MPSSEPPLSESEIYTLLATGRTSLKRGTGSSEIGSAAAVSVLGSLAASQLKGAVSTKVGLDVLSVEAGEAGTPPGINRRGREVHHRRAVPGLRGQGRCRPDDVTRTANAFRLEYQFLPRWSLEAVYGDAKSGSADIVWTRDY